MVQPLISVWLGLTFMRGAYRISMISTNYDLTNSIDSLKDMFACTCESPILSFGRTTILVVVVAVVAVVVLVRIIDVVKNDDDIIDEAVIVESHDVCFGNNEKYGEKYTFQNPLLPPPLPLLQVTIRSHFGACALMSHGRRSFRSTDS